MSCIFSSGKPIGKNCTVGFAKVADINGKFLFPPVSARSGNYKPIFVLSGICKYMIIVVYRNIFYYTSAQRGILFTQLGQRLCIMQYLIIPVRLIPIHCIKRYAVRSFKLYFVTIVYAGRSYFRHMYNLRRLKRIRLNITTARSVMIVKRIILTKSKIPRQIAGFVIKPFKHKRFGFFTPHIRIKIFNKLQVPPRIPNSGIYRIIHGRLGKQQYFRIYLSQITPHISEDFHLAYTLAVFLDTKQITAAIIPYSVNIERVAAIVLKI